MSLKRTANRVFQGTTIIWGGVAFAHSKRGKSSGLEALKMVLLSWQMPGLKISGFEEFVREMEATLEDCEDPEAVVEE